MRARLLLAPVLASLLAMVLGGGAHAAPTAESPLGQSCAEPAGQTDTPPHPQRARDTTRRSS